MEDYGAMIRNVFELGSIRDAELLFEAIVKNAFPTNDEIQTQVDELMSTADIDEQKAIYAELETLWSDLAWEVPLYYQPIWVICSDKVDQNVDTWGNVQYFWDWDIQNWTLE